MTGADPKAPTGGRSWVHLLGAATLDLVHLLGGLALLLRDSLGHLFLGPFRGRPVRRNAFAQQAVRTGVRALGVVFLDVFSRRVLAGRRQRRAGLRGRAIEPSER